MCSLMEQMQASYHNSDSIHSGFDNLREGKRT